MGEVFKSLTHSYIGGGGRGGGRSDSEFGQGQSVRILPSIGVALVIDPSAKYGRTRQDLHMQGHF